MQRLFCLYTLWLICISDRLAGVLFWCAWRCTEGVNWSLTLSVFGEFNLHVDKYTNKKGVRERNVRWYIKLYSHCQCLTLWISTSNTRVLFAGTCWRMPFEPWPILVGTIRSRWPPFCMPSIPSSHPCEKEQWHNSWQNQHFSVMHFFHYHFRALLCSRAAHPLSFACSELYSQQLFFAQIGIKDLKKQTETLNFHIYRSPAAQQTCQTDSYKLPVNWLVQWVHAWLVLSCD